jgi:hypothetical protein
VCQKRQRRCPALLRIREEALQEWTRAQTLHDVRVCWRRLGGLTTLHRFGRGHFVALAKASRARP